MVCHENATSIYHCHFSFFLLQNPLGMIWAILLFVEAAIVPVSGKPANPMKIVIPSPMLAAFAVRRLLDLFDFPQSVKLLLTQRAFIHGLDISVSMLDCSAFLEGIIEFAMLAERMVHYFPTSTFFR
jgi:hypothetical protein